MGTVSLMMSRTDYGWRWNLLTPSGVGNGVASSVEQGVYDALRQFREALGECRRVETDQTVSPAAREFVKRCFGIDVVHPGCSTSPADLLVVATDGSAAGSALGWGWVAGNGQSGSGGGCQSRRADRPLVAELRGIEAAISAIPDRRLRLLVDSRDARRWVQAWLDGESEVPCADVADVQELVSRQRARLEIEWVRGHDGHVLNEQADRLAKRGRLVAQRVGSERALA